MYYLIYKITNTINNKIYIGKHKTNDINDDYMGSGKILNKAIEKYGINNFKKEILFECSNEEEMNQKEAEIVNDEFIKRNDVYNLKIGGEGGFDYVNNTKQNLYDRTKPETFKKYQMNGKKLYKRTLEKRISEPNFDKEFRKRISEGLKGWYKENESWWLGKKHKQESIQKMKDDKQKNHPQAGSKNSQYGKIWIYNDKLQLSKSIYKEKLNEYINKGWKKGRKIKFK